MYTSTNNNFDFARGPGCWNTINPELLLSPGFNFDLELIILYPHHVPGIEEPEKEDEKQEEEEDEEEVGVEVAIHPALPQRGHNCGR